jgi:two-component system alkaline phosphatase synthesis response regulator PhoP/two-component system response regulator VicR
MDAPSKKILIVEDDQFLREFYEELLKSEGFTIDSAPDGEMASAKIYQGGFDLILLDIMLPKRDGLQILQANKATPPQVANGPIVVLTNIGQDAIIRQCFELGASGYIIKSALNPDQVLQEIKNYLQISTLIK